MFKGNSGKLNHNLIKFFGLFLSVSMLVSVFVQAAPMTEARAKKSKSTETATEEAEPAFVNEEGAKFTDSRIEYTVIVPATEETPGKVSVSGNTLKKKTQTVTIPEIVIYEGYKYFPYSIGDYAFVGSSFTSIVFEDDIYGIGEYAFAMSALESIEIPETVKEIGAGAFALSNSLKSVSIGRFTADIAHNAFSYCDSLTELTIASKNKNYAAVDGMILNKKKTLLISGAAAGGDIVIPATVKKLSAYAFEGNHKITSVDLGTLIKAIPEDTFYDCTALEKIVIGKAVTKISGNPFKYCTSLKSFEVDEENTKYRGAGPILYSKTGKTLYAYPSAKGSLALPSAVKTIGEYAFCGSGLTELSIPANIKSISKGAFYDCAELEEVTFEKRKITLYEDIASSEDMIFGNAMPYLVIVLPYSKDSNQAGSVEEKLKLNCPSTVIIVNK